MSDEREENTDANRPIPIGPPIASAEENPTAALSVEPRPGRPSGAARWLAAWATGLLIAVIAVVLLSPFWAPALTRLLPWGPQAVANKDFSTLAARVSALDQRPGPSKVDLGPLKSAQAALAQRIEGLDTAIAGLRQEQAAAATKQSLTGLAQRLDASDAQSASRAAADTAELAKARDQLTRLDSLATDNGGRLAQLEHQMQGRSGVGQSDAMMLLALLQMREAVEEGRPFPADYDVFKALAHDNPELAAAAEPLAGAARDGVASRADLTERLAVLTDQMSSARRSPAKSPTWWGQALDRMSGLVTVRRLDAAAKTGPGASLHTAQQALARDDLPAAVADVNGLTGAEAETARPWLELARDRLAAKSALTHLQEGLTARLGAATAPHPAAAPPPAKSAVPQSAAPRSPS